jgi:hypothetical protein
MFYFREVLFYEFIRSRAYPFISQNTYQWEMLGGGCMRAHVQHAVLFLTSETVRRASAASSPTPTYCRCYNFKCYILSNTPVPTYYLFSKLGYFTSPRS